MRVPAPLLTELSHLFSCDALEADKNGDPEEAERLWDISDELHEASVVAERK